MTLDKRLPVLDIIAGAVLLTISLLVGRYATSLRDESAAAFGFALASPLLLGIGGYLLLKRNAPDLAVTRGGRHAAGWGAGVLLGTLVLAMGAMVSNIPFDLPEFSWVLAQHLTILLVVPVAEEIFFRGFLYRLAQRAMGNLAAAVAVSLLFGFLHPWLPFGWVMIVLSLLLCWAVTATGTLWWVMIVHLLWNGWSEAWHAPDAIHRFVIVAVGVAAALLMTWRGLASRERP